jgi:hypothetical protein
MSLESFRLPAGESPFFRRPDLRLVLLALFFVRAHRARAAAAIFARAFGDIRRRGSSLFPDTRRKIEESSCCNRSIRRRIETARSKF